MKRSDLLSSFTPSTMSAETLEAIFVKREPLARKIVGSITHSAATGGREHHIAVGPRGIGKTHLLSLVTYRLLTDPMFLDKAVIAWLREEEWGIGSIGELYEAILMQLASDDTPILAVHQAARVAVDQLAGCSIDELADKAEYLLTQVLDDRMLVVVVENLDLLFESIGTDDQHRLRAYLQNERNTVLLASTPSLSESISQRSGLFFGFFAIYRLDELTVDEARTLLGNIAALRDDEEGRRLTEYLQTDEATRRLQTVQDLVGGHPRLWVLMAECITTERLEELIELLLTVLDDLTPYYQAQIAALTGQQRKIVMAMTRADGALTPKVLAERTRIQDRVVAKQLGDLSRLGFVRPAALPEGTDLRDKRLRPYELREPLLRHVLEVKQTRGRPLRLVVLFLRAWYDRAQLEAWAAGVSALESRYAHAALHPPVTEIDDPSPTRADQLFDEGDFEGALRDYDARLASGHEDATIHRNRGAALGRLGRYDEAVDAYQRSLVLDPTNGLTHYNRGVALLHLDRTDEAVAAFEAATTRSSGSANYHWGLGTALSLLDRHAEANEEYGRALAIDPTHSAAAWNQVLQQVRVLNPVIDTAQLNRAILSSHDSAFLSQNLLWLLEDIQEQPDTEIRQANRTSVLAVCDDLDRTPEFTVALLESVNPEGAATPRETHIALLREWSDVLAAPSPLVASVLGAAATFAETGDGSALLKLPPEVREAVQQLAGSGEPLHDD